jgi:hypothetical protein
MILFWAILFIEFEAITEGIVKKTLPNVSEFLFKEWVQNVTALILFLIWFFVIALPFDKYYVPIVKIILGFVFVRFMIFDLTWNIVRICFGDKISIWSYGTTKKYDLFMTKLGSFGWFIKFVLGCVGIAFLLGISA